MKITNTKLIYWNGNFWMLILLNTPLHIIHIITTIDCRTNKKCDEIKYEEINTREKGKKHITTTFYKKQKQQQNEHRHKKSWTTYNYYWCEIKPQTRLTVKQLKIKESIVFKKICQIYFMSAQATRFSMYLSSPTGLQGRSWVAKATKRCSFTLHSW